MFKRKQKYFVGVAGKFFKLVANALPAPVATAATSITSTSFTANWDPYDGADTYYLDVSISPTFSSFVLQNQPIAAPTTSYNVTGLTSCTTYYYRVRAEGLVPSPLSAPTLTPSGTQSTGTVISISSTGVWLNQGATFQYRWTRDGVPIALGATYTIQPIDDGTVIRCEVLNTNNFGSSTWVPTSNSVSAVDVDPDAQAFITAAGITNSTEKTAINNLVLNWKGIGAQNNTYDLWTYTNRLHIYVGGTSGSMAVNVKTATSTFTFNGGWTFDANGATPNGTSGYINTGVNASTINAELNNGICRIVGFNTNSAVIGGDGYLLGGDTYFYLLCKYIDNNMYYRNYNSVEGSISQSGVDTRNVYQQKVKGATGSVRRAKSQVVSQGADITPTNSGSEFLSAINFGFATVFDNRQRNFDALILGLDVTNAISDVIVDIINQYQTDLGRNNYQP